MEFSKHRDRRFYIVARPATEKTGSDTDVIPTLYRRKTDRNFGQKKARTRRAFFTSIIVQLVVARVLDRRPQTFVR